MKNKLNAGLFLTLLALTTQGFSQARQPIVKFDNPKTLYTPKGYSHSAIIDLGNCKMVLLSGQVPLDNQGNLVGKGDLAKQAEQVFLNIQNAIGSAGGTMEHVVRLNIYLVDGADIQPVRDVRDKFIYTKTPPASTLVKVSGLFRDDILLEIEATFIIPTKQ